LISETISKLNVKRLRSLATGFPGVHSFNAALTLVYTLAQTLVFARVLPHNEFALTILVQAIGLYLVPLNQAVARANFVLLRERSVRDGEHHAPEAAAAYTFNKFLLLTVTFAAPLALGIDSLTEYLAFAGFLFYCTFTNIWYFEIQMSLMAIDRALEFERVSFLRRLVNYTILIIFFFERSFLFCALAFAVQTLCFHLWVTMRMARHSDLFSWPHDLNRARLKEHLERTWIALQAVFAEWLTLNAPYAVFLMRFGVGPGIVTIDAILKLLRMVLAVTRNLAEIALPRVSRALLLGDIRSGRLSAFLAIGGGLGAAAVTAVAVTVWERLSFGLLLGPNNVVPVGAGEPAAVTMLAGVAIAAAGHFIGHTGDRRSIPILVTASITSVIGFAGYVLITQATILEALWASATALSAISLVAVGLLVRSLRA